MNLDNISTKISLEKGVLLKKSYSKSPYMLYLKSGDISVSITLPNGKWIPLRQVKPNSFFSVTTLGPLNDNLSFLTMSNVEMLVIPKKDFISYIKQDDKSFNDYMDFLHGRVQFLLNKLIMFSIQNNRQRLAYFFLNEMFIQRSDTISIDMTKTSILECLGISRGSFYRELNNLVDIGAIDIINNNLYLCNYDILHNVMSES